MSFSRIFGVASTKFAKVPEAVVVIGNGVGGREFSKMSDTTGNSNHPTNDVGKRGALIALEGCDKAGKSTQCQLLVEALNKAGKPAQLFAFPDRTTEIGKVINEYLKGTKDLSDQTVHLLFSANRWEVAPKIRHALFSGTTVIVDRYAFSGVAFSAAKGMDLKWCMHPDVGLAQPDTVFFLNLSKEAASRRGDFGQERYERTEFQEKVREVFLRIQEPNYWKVIDADRTQEDVHNDLYKCSTEVIAASENEPLLPLWEDLTSFLTLTNNARSNKVQSPVVANGQ